MKAEEFLAQVVSALERANIPIVVTGSFASSAHGEVRGTRDLDIVITRLDQLRALVAEFPKDRYSEELDALEALQHTSQFNIIDFRSSWKVG